MLLLLLAGAAYGAPVAEERIAYAAARFRVVRAAPEQVQLVWKDEQGTPFRTFDKVQAWVAKNGKTTRFLMNAGIFEPGGIPTGLHVENGRTFHDLNLSEAPGNFFLKPNGVFWITGGADPRRGFIAPSETFSKSSKANPPAYAVQSGPLLLIDGRRHPAFIQGSSNKLHRNGVGIDARGNIVFAITDRTQAINLWDFAGLFLHLGCRNALFLDGDISQMSINPDRPIESNQFGAIFVISE